MTMRGTARRAHGHRHGGPKREGLIGQVFEGVTDRAAVTTVIHYRITGGQWFRPHVFIVYDGAC